MNEVSKVGAVEPLCAKCGGVLKNWHCEPCRSTNGAVRGVLGEDMPGAVWIAAVNLDGHADTRVRSVMMCAVSVGGEYSDGGKARAHSWVQTPRGRWGEGNWSTQSASVAGTIFQVWGEAMLQRALSAEWVIEEQASRRARAAAEAPELEDPDIMAMRISDGWAKEESGGEPYEDLAVLIRERDEQFAAWCDAHPHATAVELAVILRGFPQ